MCVYLKVRSNLILSIIKDGGKSSVRVSELLRLENRGKMDGILKELADIKYALDRSSVVAIIAWPEGEILTFRTDCSRLAENAYAQNKNLKDLPSSGESFFLNQKKLRNL